jgi:hypothetical protein
MKNWRQVESTVENKLLCPFISNNNLFPDSSRIPSSYSFQIRGSQVYIQD